uniref:Uncharacterized protein n=1 Tax=Siphoviridae sp. cttqT1 TaxID=2827961 RepID=A0A8S5TP38_9CAUD|nr:MAG TPA: hypothetical protein [Siphoviridae sp. cttqT1]
MCDRWRRVCYGLISAAKLRATRIVMSLPSVTG